MAKLIRCECGFVARGADGDQVVDAIRLHMGTDHPALLAGIDLDTARRRHRYTRPATSP